MAQSRHAIRNGDKTRRTSEKGRGAYIVGNTVTKPQTMPHIAPHKISHATRKNRDKARHMSFGYVAFLACALVAAGVILTGYIGLQSEVTNSIKSIAKMESRLNSMRVDNNEEYVRITSNVDLEEVKRVAIQELGMKYAEEGQIVNFSGESSDYVRQLAEIPQ